MNPVPSLLDVVINQSGNAGLLAAAFGIVGVVVGALIAAGVHFISEVWRRRSERQVAARMVGADLEAMLGALKFVELRGHWWPDIVQIHLGSRAWESQRATLARDAPLDTWTDLRLADMAVTALIEMRSNFLSVGVQPTTPLDPKSILALGDHKTSIEQGAARLEKYL